MILKVPFLIMRLLLELLTPFEALRMLLCAPGVEDVQSQRLRCEFPLRAAPYRLWFVRKYSALNVLRISDQGRIVTRMGEYNYDIAPWAVGVPLPRVGISSVRIRVLRGRAGNLHIGVCNVGCLTGYALWLVNGQVRKTTRIHRSKRLASNTGEVLNWGSISSSVPLVNHHGPQQAYFADGTPVTFGYRSDAAGTVVHVSVDYHCRTLQFSVADGPLLKVGYFPRDAIFHPFVILDGWGDSVCFEGVLVRSVY